MPMVVDPYSVRVSGGWRPLVDDKGIIPLVVNKEKQLPFDASEAGPGEFSLIYTLLNTIQLTTHKNYLVSHTRTRTHARTHTHTFYFYSLLRNKICSKHVCV